MADQGVTCGIYKIEAPTGAFYVGSSNNIEKRINHHAWAVRHGRIYRSPKLYAAYAKYGDMKVSILEECVEAELLIREQWFIDTLKPSLNSSALATRVEMTPEVRAKIGARHRRENIKPCEVCGKPFSSKPCLNRRFCSWECSGKSKKGIPRSEEMRTKLSAAKKGRPNGLEGKAKSQEAKDKIIATLKGRKHSPERVAAIIKGRWGK